MSPFFGLSAFTVTPTKDNGVVDCDHLGRLVERLKLDGISSIGVLGSTGGYMYLTAPERDRALRAAVEAAGDVPIVAGIGAMCTRDVLQHVKGAEDAGASGLLLAPVSYLPLTDRDVAQLFEETSATTDLPICFYNNPGTTHFSLSEELLVELAGKGVIASVKNPAPADGDFEGQMKRLRANTTASFSLGYSGDAKICGALSAGADAWYSVLAGTFPEIAVQLWSAREDSARLAALDEKLAPLWELFNAYGSIRVMHEAVGMVGLGDVALPRPLLPLDKSVRKQIEDALAVLGDLEGLAA